MTPRLHRALDTAATALLAIPYSLALGVMMIWWGLGAARRSLAEVSDRLSATRRHAA